MKHKTLFCMSMAAVMAFSVAALAACGGDTDPKGPEGLGSLVPTKNYVMPTSEDAKYRRADNSTDVSVHDPSVFYDENSKTYYAFGSHFMVASSEDLIKWKQEVGDGSSEETGRVVSQKLYGDGVDWRTVLSQSVAYAGKIMPSTWAPDVNYHDGKYYMYYSLTSDFGHSKSVIGRVSSTNVLGPYSNEEIILKTPEGGGPGGTPNAIDPELFTDKEGKLWMVYGSHFAGIYIKELYNSGANWGLPKEDGWGKLLWKGGDEEDPDARDVVEGPFVFYNPLTEYYYLMTTYGALQTTYNMRIARSENPDGPYKDITGADVATTSLNGKLHGNKVAGSYHFAEQGGDKAYAAMGHNSVVQNPKTGEWFVVYHTRRQSGNTVDAGHRLMTNQLFFNEDGWPVMSPVAYVGEKFGLITQEQAAGDYDIVVHSTGTTTTIAESVKYTLSADGKVLQGTTEKGTWSIKDSYYVTITIDSVAYNGVIVPGWDTYTPQVANQKPVFAITAISKLSDQGGSLWAISPREA